MILLFPDTDTLRLALTSSIVPADVTLAPAAVSYDSQGLIYVEPTVTLSKATTKNLDRIGVKGSRRHGSDSPVEVGSWLELLPVTKDADTPALSSQAAVLFELDSADDLPALVTEMLRLGTDRQSFRWFAAADGETKRVLLRVVGPPYYTLLRALDPSAAGTAGAVRAYTERAPRVWVEVGHTHPLAAQVRVADGQLVLIRAPRDWLFLADAPFQDVYDILQFKLPAAPVEWAETPAPQKMTVPLRLTAGNAADSAELWVLRTNPVEQLDTLVRDADDRLTQRLMFAVAADPAGNRVVVLRTRPSKLPPPALPLDDALGFKPFWKLPNLFLPAGRRLHPTLRRDAVRKLLADDPDQVVWLYPDGSGGFTPESVPDAAFRSLEDWVDYVIEAEAAPLAAWIEAARFDFAHFVCTDGGGPKPRPDKGDKEPKAKDEAGDKAARAAQPKAGAKGKPADRPAGPADFLPPPAEVKPPSEWKVKREALEKEFMAAEGPLDVPERQALWAPLAVANAGEGAQSEAAVCWLNALWDADPLPPDWVAGWARSELPHGGAEVKADDFDRKLKGATESVSDHRTVVAMFLWLATRTPLPAWLPARLPAVQKYLEKHETALPVRAVWLAAYRLAQLAGADVLGLARVRDRLLQRLLAEGLSPERDLPSFLRNAGLRDSERLRVVRDKALDLHETVRKWIEAHAKKPGAAGQDDPILRNLPFVDLLFAFALARLGEATPAKRLLENARREMVRPVPPLTDYKQFDAIIATISDNYLYSGFRHRVEQALLGKPHTGQLSPELVRELDDIARKGQSPDNAMKGPTGQSGNPYWQAEYVIGRLRQQSRVLEPHENLDPYATVTRHSDRFKKEVVELQQLRDPAKLADRVRRLYREGIPDRPLKEVQFLLLHQALPLAPRVGEAFTAELLNLVPAALAYDPPQKAGAPVSADATRVRAELLQRALTYAAHFDRRDDVRQLVARFVALVRHQPEEQRLKLINVIAGQSLQSLRKFGLRDDIDQLLGQIQAAVLQGSDPAGLRKRYAGQPPAAWAAVLQALSNLAAGWLTFGLNDRAAPILDLVRNELLGSGATAYPPQDYTELARAYVRAVGQGPSESGLPRITELFRQMGAGKINNSYTTNRYYSRFHLNLVEEVVQALVSDEFALGPAGRRWLDDDEYLVRRRIHADMRRHLDHSGL
jgi:hypothetical protein